MPAKPAGEAATYRLTLEYDGSRLAGWQVQKNARTVAGELLRVLAEAGFDPAVKRGLTPRPGSPSRSPSRAAAG